MMNPFRGVEGVVYVELPTTWREVLGELSKIGYVEVAGKPDSIFKKQWDQLCEIRERRDGTLIWDNKSIYAYEGILYYNYEDAKATIDGEVMNGTPTPSRKNSL